MFAPVDAWYVWVGVGLASLAVLGVAVALPAAPPPDAAALARTVDSVATSPYAAVAEHPTGHAAVWITPRAVRLRNRGAVAHAGLRHGPVTPVEDGRLRRVLTGTPPGRVFASPSAFARAAVRAREREPRWRRTDRILVRRVDWEGVDVTLVG